MSRLIDADALWMDVIHAMDYCDDILEIIEQQPTVESERKTGKWLKHKHENIEHVECSNCKAWFLDKYFIHKSYCPNCGSYNGGEDD